MLGGLPARRRTKKNAGRIVHSRHSKIALPRQITEHVPPRLDRYIKQAYLVKKILGRLPRRQVKSSFRILLNRKLLTLGIPRSTLRSSKTRRKRLSPSVIGHLRFQGTAVSSLFVLLLHVPGRGEKTPEGSRRRGFAVAAAIQELGRNVNLRNQAIRAHQS